MADSKPIKVAITSNDKTAVGEVQWLKLTTQERWFKALKIVAVGAVASLLILPIPVVHLGIPAVILATLVLALVGYMRVSFISGGTAKCPACGQDFDIFPAADDWPIYQVCPRCEARTTIRPAE